MRNTRFTILFIVAAILAVFAFSLYAQDASPPSEAEIVTALGTALNEGDVDTAMSYIHDNAYFGTVDVDVSLHSGKAAIRELFDGLVAGNFRIETEIIATYSDGLATILISDTQTWGDFTDQMGIEPFNATEVYVVYDGLIIGITWVMNTETFEAIMANMASPPVVTADDIVGTWRWYGQSFRFRFNDDGTYAASDDLDNLNSDRPQDSGTYIVEDGMLTMTSGETAYYCMEGEVGIYALNMRDDGVLEFILESDACNNRRAPSERPQPFTKES